MLSARQLLIIIAYVYGAGSHLQYKVQFTWVNQEDEAEVIPIILMHMFMPVFECLFLYKRMLIIFCLLCFLFLFVGATDIFTGNNHV